MKFIVTVACFVGLSLGCAYADEELLDLRGPHPPGQVIEGVVLPKLQERCPVNYPVIAQRLREAGMVKLEYVVEVDGTTSDVSVVTSSGYEDLDAAAIECTKRLLYSPAKHSGQPVRARWQSVQVYRLPPLGHRN